MSVLFLSCSGAGSVFASSISDAQKEKEELKGQLNEVQDMIRELRSSKEDVQEKITQLDARLTEISQRIVDLNEQLSQKESEITDTQQELLEATKDEKQQFERMKKRIQFMYENRTVSFLDTLLASEGIGEFLNRTEYIYEISKYDRDMLKQYQDTVEAVANMEATLENEKEELSQLALQVQEEQKAVSLLLDEKENQLAQIGEDISEAQQMEQMYAAEMQAQDEIIAMIQAEEARKQEEARKKAEEKARKKAEEEARRKAEEEARKKAEEEARQEEQESEEEDVKDSPSEDTSESEEPEADPKDPEEPGESEEPEEPKEEEPEEPEEEEPKEPEYTGGVFVWPCPSSTRVTSDYGPRTAPTGGASSYHRGLDIGAAYGADIVAAADGVVAFAGYSNASGNYLTIRHGNGVYTVYMHCSSLVAASGQSVSAGQVIAKVGSTGISTGNHLHFGVSVNGSYVSPWDYLR